MRFRSLNQISARELRPLLQREAEHWARELCWDFAEVSEAVASGLARRALAGRCAEEAAQLVAYAYYMFDGGRAIVGSLFAAERYRDGGLEESLLEAVLEEALGDSGNERVECQTLFSTARGVDTCFARAGFVSRPRHYLMRRLADGALPTPRRSELKPLRREDLQTAASIIYRSHEGSLDAALNMTYATPSHCRAFVETLALRSGCGRFDSGASFMAVERGEPVGVVLASRLSTTNGHLCQVSVLPEGQGRGIGAQLVCASLAAFRSEGLESASLSVTVGNERAYGLYTRLGFGLCKAFAAHAWVRPPARIELPA